MPSVPTKPAKPAATRISAITYCGHSKLIFLWPLIVLGFVFSLFSSANSGVLGWIYLLTLITVILTIAVDMSRNVAIVWGLVVLLILVFGRWLADVKNFPILGDIADWFSKKHVTYDRGTGLSFSVIMSVVYVISLIKDWANNRYTMTHNEVIHHVVGRGDMSVGRGARVITFQYPDLLEFILAGAGTIVVYDNTGRTQICRSEHVVMLPMRSRRIERLIASMEVTSDDSTTHDAAAADHDAANDDLQ